ncbi:MAG: tetratricopeptide repeat protein [Gudongella sp.]|nr:tetratricopeptide repeat protein [Gudongella sp.]
MGIDEKYFNEKVANISFVQLKEDADIILNDYVIDSSLPLPVITDKLLRELSGIEAKNEITLERIIEGIIYLLGADVAFIHADEYIKILKAYNKDIDKVIFTRAINALEKDDLEKSGLYFRAYNTLFGSVEGSFYYAMVLEALSKDKFFKEKLDEGNSFLEESTKILEEILNNNPKFYPSYYKLGFHYKFYEQFVKAKLTWEKVLLFDTDPLRKDEVRIELENIEYDYSMELVELYLSNLNYSKAIEILSNLIPKFKKDWNINYLLGMAYRGFGDNQVAIEYFESALDLNPQNVDIYNELGISYFNGDDILGAIEVFSKGLEYDNEDYRMYFNRGLGYLNIGQIDKGYEDISKANIINPEDENIRNQLEILKNNFNDYN